MSKEPKQRIGGREYFRRLWKSVFNLTSWGSDVPMTTTRSGRMVVVPGTAIDWQKEFGEIWTTPATQACLNWYWKNSIQSPPTVRTMVGGEWKVIDYHPLTELLRNPNEVYDGNILLQAWLLSWFDSGMRGGNAYAGIERDRSGEPAQLWWLPHRCVKAMRNKNSRRLIDYYEYRVGQNVRAIPLEDMVHLRFGMDPTDPRYGLSPTAAIERPGATLNRVSTYTANVMRHAGALGGLATPDGENVTFDPEAFVNLWQEKHTDDNNGRMMAYDVPIKLEFPKNSPQEMALETLPDRSESEAAALFGLPPQVVGLHVGRLSKTYANYAEAREAAWEEGIVPNQILMAGQLGRKLLPQFGIDPAQQEVWFDISKVRPLQPDLDKEHERVREDYKAGMIDRYTAKVALGYDADEKDKGVYAMPKSAPGDDLGPDGKPKPKPSGNGTGKMLVETIP